MTTAETAAETADKTASGTRPYAMSWLDAVNDWVAGLPVPPVVAYAGAAVASMAGLVGTQAWLTGGLPASTPFLAFLAAQPVIAVAMSHALRRAIRRSFAAFRPLMPAGDDASAERFEYRLVNAPARAVASATLIAVLVLPPAMLGLIGQGTDAQLHDLGFAGGAASLAVAWAYVMLLAGALFGFVVHLIHQLREIAALLDGVRSLDLYRLEPVYAFSATTGLAAILVTANNYAWYATQPALLRDPLSVVMGGLAGVVALGAFVWPLWGAHRLLVREKSVALAENGTAFNALTRQLRAQIATGELGNVEQIGKAIGILEIERALLARIPTWPWRAETLRATLAAVVLPIAVWLGQFVLRRILGD